MDESPIEPLAELLGEGGDINQTDSCGRTVLHNLAADGNATLLALAIEACPTVRKLETLKFWQSLRVKITGKCSFRRLNSRQQIATGKLL